MRELFKGDFRSRPGSRRRRKSSGAKLWTFDIETDPFRHGRLPKAFCCAVYNENVYQEWWGRDCLIKMAEFMRANPGSYYAHNGGRFDFHFLTDYADPGSVQILNGRYAKMKMGDSTLIDSFLLMPFALDRYQKTKIDYSKFEKETRQANKREILFYLYTDCVNLYRLLIGFHETVGNHLTIGSAAFAKLKSLGIKPPKCDEEHDELFRRFYFGGRTQAFRSGHFPKVDLQYLDINSAYPWAMLDVHPWGAEYRMRRREPARLGPCFVIFTGRSRGALPARNPETGRIDYDDTTGKFQTTGWEFMAGLETGAVTVDKIHAIFEPCNVQDFGDYVHGVYALRMEAKKNGDKIRELAFKFLLNSAYGKFATNPREFKDYEFRDFNDPATGNEWEFQTDIAGSNLSLWAKQSERWWNGFYDVATAASITGKVRAYMWESLCKGEAWYCDTDSIIGSGYQLPEGDSLGQWKSEGEIVEVAIGGRKMYAIRTKKDGWKVASKGSKLTSAEVVQLAQGATIDYAQDAPTFRIVGGATFTTRRLKST